MSKLLSIIIPTRNRQIYCIDSINSILPDINSTCEIIIQDNSSDDSLKSMITDLNSESIVYNYNSNPLSFIDNFEEALNLSKGKYFIVLGDDDSTTKDILTIVEWMDRENIESLSSTFVVDYIWPNDKIEKYKNGYLSIPDYKGSSFKVNVAENLEALIKNGFLSYQTFNLPRTYHGIVKRSCMNEVKKRTGRYFGGLTPDIYSTVSLACIIKNHVIIDYPFSIAGACPASATVNATVGGHAGKLIDAPHFNNRGKYIWEKTVPKYYSVETIWAETAIKALNDMNYKNWDKLFNNYKLYVYGIFINKKYIFNLSLNETLVLNENLNISKFSHLVNLIIKVISISFHKLFTTRKKTMNNETVNLKDIVNLVSCKENVYQKINHIKIPYANR